MGNRSKNPNKYLDDALILEKGYENENIDIEPFNSKLDVESLWNCRPWVDCSEDYYVDLDNPEWTKEVYYDGYKDRLWTDEYFRLK